MREYDGFATAAQSGNTQAVLGRMRFRSIIAKLCPSVNQDGRAFVVTSTWELPQTASPESRRGDRL